MAKTLTNANSALALAIVGLYNTPQLIQGYATDDAFAAADVNGVEAVMGVDGRLSAGYTPVPTPLDITLQADSLSNDVFDNWIAAMQNAREVYVANATILLPALQSKYAFTNGYLTAHSPMAQGKKILQPRKFTITFESCSRAQG